MTEQMYYRILSMNKNELLMHALLTQPDCYYSREAEYIYELCQYLRDESPI